MIFYLGTHKPRWLARTDVPLFVSRRRLAECARPPHALGLWCLDSGGFTELALYGRWVTPPGRYAAEARRWAAEVGGLQWAACQDWMCEPAMLARTGLAVAGHQRRTVASYLCLRGLAPEVPWAPVLQGWHYRDYLAHVDQYAAAGIDLAALPVVGLGSVCRRQDTGMAEALIRELCGMGLRLHAFGFHRAGLRRSAPYLASADSMAWSLEARHSPPLPGCPHRSCANCLRYALAWREGLTRSVAGAADIPRQALLFSP